MSTARVPRPVWAGSSPVLLRPRSTVARLRQNWAALRRRTPSARVVVGALVDWRTPVLSVGGFGSFVAAAWTTFGTGAAWATAGVSMLALEALMGDDDRP